MSEIKLPIEWLRNKGITFIMDDNVDDCFITESLYMLVW